MLELQEEAGFQTFRDILLFAAALGFYHGRRVSFTAASGDPIRYETLTTPVFSETLINMIAANVVDDDPEILDASRTEERIKIFEEYANGGLEYLREQVIIRHQPAALLLVDLVVEAFAGGTAQPSVEDLLGNLNWQ